MKADNTHEKEATSEQVAEPVLSRGQKLIAEITSDLIALSLEPDSKEQAILDAVCTLVDRMEELEAVIAHDGLMLISPTGPRVHAAAIEHRNLAVALPKLLSQIVLANSQSGASKDPTKQRAANARWAKRDELVAYREAAANL